MIYDFAASAADGAQPTGGLTVDGTGRLYGVTLVGGSSAGGIAYRLTNAGLPSVPWVEEILHSFDPYTEGDQSRAHLLLGSSGEVYGTLANAGMYGRGSTFRLDNLPGWPITILHAFRLGGDAGFPQSGVIFGPCELLYGTAPGLGDTNVGAAYSLSPLGDSSEYSQIHRFGHQEAGSSVAAALLADSAGPLFGLTDGGGANYTGTACSGGLYYGVAFSGGAHGGGTVFQIMP